MSTKDFPMTARGSQLLESLRLTMANFGDERLPQRFWSKVSPCPMSGCWIWTGTTTQRGYGS